VSLLSPVALARLDSRLRPLLVTLSAPLAVRLYSAGRRRFLARLAEARPEPYAPPPELARTLWGLRFRAPLGNAAGMFKTGEGYELCWRQGAGYWLSGTTTARPRSGNRGHGVAQPFAPYPRSGAASNWLGLPNDGDETVAARLARMERREGCPVGASTAAVPCPGGGGGGAGSGSGEDEIALLIRGLALYDQAGVDFLEVNESCPNTGLPHESLEEQWAGLGRRLERIAEGFLARRTRPLPVIVKVSVDTDPALVPELLDRLVELGFDGVDFGNTSTDYAALRAAVAPPERRLYDLFTGRFGGGVSGRPLRERSLALVRAAAAHLEARPPAREFHVVRTGGLETGGDLAASEAAGAPLSGWFTGYFEAFARQGHGLYRAVYEEMLRR
jgi:dihydroorotate dehydrogenase